MHCISYSIQSLDTEFYQITTLVHRVGVTGKESLLFPTRCNIRSLLIPNVAVSTLSVGRGSS